MYRCACDGRSSRDSLFLRKDHETSEGRHGTDRKNGRDGLVAVYGAFERKKSIYDGAGA